MDVIIWVILSFALTLRIHTLTYKRSYWQGTLVSSHIEYWHGHVCDGSQCSVYTYATYGTAACAPVSLLSYMHTNLYVYVYMHTNPYVHVYMHTNTCVYVYLEYKISAITQDLLVAVCAANVCMYVCMCVIWAETVQCRVTQGPAHTCICMYVCMYACNMSSMLWKLSCMYLHT